MSTMVMPTLTVDDLVLAMSEADFDAAEYGGYACAICLDESGACAAFRLRYSHSFCPGCLRTHALAQLREHRRAFAPCPLCKKPLRKEEVARAFAATDVAGRSEFVSLLRKAASDEPWPSSASPPAAAASARPRAASWRAWLALRSPRRAAGRAAARTGR